MYYIQAYIIQCSYVDTKKKYYLTMIKPFKIIGILLFNILVSEKLQTRSYIYIRQ